MSTDSQISLNAKSATPVAENLPSGILSTSAMSRAFLREQSERALTSPFGSTRVGIVDETSVGRIQFGRMTLSPEHPIPNVVVLSRPEGDRPLGAGIDSDVAYVAFKNMWTFNPGKGLKLEKTTVVGSAEELASFKETMSVEMLTSPESARITAAQVTDRVEFYFNFVEIDSLGRAVIPAGTGSVELIKAPVEDSASQVRFIVDDRAKDQQWTATIEYLSNREQSLSTVHQMVKDRLELGKFFSAKSDQPTVSILGASGLIWDGPKTMQRLDDGRGATILVDFGLSLEKAIEKGLSPDHVTHAIVSHPHADHIAGLPDFLQFRAVEHANGTPKLKLVTNQATWEVLENQILSVLGTEEGSRVVAATDVQLLERSSDYQYVPVNLGCFQIEFFDVRHNFEDSKGKPATLGFKATVSFKDGETEGKAAYVFSGDTQVGYRYLYFQARTLREVANSPEASAAFAPEAGSEFYGKLDASLKVVRGYSVMTERPRIDELSQKMSSGLTNSEFALALELIRNELMQLSGEEGVLTKAAVMDGVLLSKLATTPGIPQINYVDAGGGQGMVKADDEVFGSLTVSGNAAAIHPSVHDASALPSRSGAKDAIWLAGHCNPDTKVPGSFVTAAPGCGATAQVFELRTGGQAIVNFELEKTPKTILRGG